MLKKFAFAAFAAVPALVFSSCSSPEEAATDSVKDAVVDLAELIEDNKSESVEDIIAEINDYLADVTPDLIAEFEDLTEAERVAVIKNIAQSEEGKKLGAAFQSLQDNESLGKLLSTAMFGDTSHVAALPLETKLQAVDICANLVKLAIAIGVDSREVQKALDEAF